MPTPIEIESFQHQVLRINGPWYTVTDAGSSLPCHDGSAIVFDEGNPRTADHAIALKLSNSGSAGVRISRNVTGGGQTTVVSFYFKTTDTTNPGATIVLMDLTHTTVGHINLNTSGQVQAQVGSGTAQNSATDYADGSWHRVDAKYVCTSTSGTLDVQVDGNAITQATGTVTVASLASYQIGASAASAAYDIWYSDIVFSATSGDYPMGDHICKLLAIDGEGNTGNQSTGAFQDSGGGTTESNFYTFVDDAWNGTTPELSQTGEDYVKQTANAAAGYVEFTVADPAAGDTTIWGAELISLMAAENSTTANNGETRLVDSGGTTMATTGLVDPSVSATTYTGYRICATTSPGGDGWSNADLAAVKIRFGFSTDAAPDVNFNAGAVEYAAAWSPPSTVTMEVGMIAF